MHNIGIVVNSLSQSQMAFYLIKSINKLISKSNQYDVVVFYEQLGIPCSRVHCAQLNICELWNFNSLLISTDINTTLIANQAINSASNIFYVWDLEWLRREKQDYIYNLSAYKTTLVARSQDHVPLIENYCNQKVKGVIENFNLEEFLEV